MDAKSLFVAADGTIRIVWRLLIFLAVFVGCELVLQLSMAHLSPWIAGRELALNRGEMNPQGLLASEIVNLLSLAVALVVMMGIERRSLADYGLGRSSVAGRRLIEGAVWGGVMVVGMVLLQSAEGVFHFGSLALSGREALKTGLLWAATTLAVGFFEEISFRGYLQSTLASGMGFWRAAVVTSLLFGGIHLAADSFYSWMGVVSASLFGFVFCVILWRTGSLWMAIGFHFAVDFTETFFFSAPTPKQQMTGHLLNCTLQGPWWLTGSSVGPEASVNGLIMFVIVFALLWRVRFKTAAMDPASRAA